MTKRSSFSIPRRTWQAALLLASISLNVVPAAEMGAQSHSWRRYAHGGLEIELRDDWESPTDRPWFFRATRGPAEIVFVLWLPVRDSWYRDFEAWVTAALADVERVQAVSAVTSRSVAGLKAVTYTARKGLSASGSTIRETWIGVPDPPGGTVFVFSMTTSSRGVELEDDLMVYEQMVKSMRLDPATLAKYREVP